jgi:PAS domain S-box-containing protein
VGRPPSDPALARHLERVDTYMRHSGLLGTPQDRAGLRATLADFVRERTPALLDRWVRDIGTALGIPQDDWTGIKRDIEEAMGRWARHIADPDDIETYVFLRRHARRGFISHFPASRFLVSQMRLVQLLLEELRERFADEPALGNALARLLESEFGARMLHITDFFVEAREEQLLEQEASYRRAIDHAPACILSVDAAEGRIIDANGVAERLLGFPRASLVGRPLEELLPAVERSRAEALWKAARERGHASRDDLHLITGDDRPIPVFVNVGYIEYGDRRWLQLICVDLTERKLLESQLIQSEKMAAIGQLAAGLAHELRNPLAIVMNALFDLRALLDPSGPEVAEDLRIAEEEIGRAQSIIKNLLEFSRESGAEVERVDVNELFTRTIQLMQKYIENSGVRVTTELAAIPPCVANLNAMRHILLNLITNAVQAMPDGGELTLRTVRVGTDRIRLEVGDTGVGIPAAHLKDIFNPFFTTKAPGQGTGLGLSVVHSIVDRYHGEIQVASQVGAGTTFAIELPCPCHADATGDAGE